MSFLHTNTPDSLQFPLLASAMQRATKRKTAGVALIQVIVAMMMVVLCGATGLNALIVTNRKASAMRTLNNARAIVQRNVDTALGVPFNYLTTPPILAFTSGTGSVYDDDGGGDNLVNIVVSRSGTGAVIRGTLTRIVLAETNSDAADIRRVTFRLNYTYRQKAYQYEMTTLRAID